MTTIISALIILAIVWYAAPHYILVALPIPLRAKLRFSMRLLRVTGLSLIPMLPAFLAPAVVPLALLFTKWEDNHLPTLFRIWDNDVSINGDHVADWGLTNTGPAYYASSPPRSFWARYVWLVFRNRCSWLNERLGHRYQPGEFDSIQTYGDPKVNRDRAGWYVRYTDHICQLMVVIRVGKLVIRTNWGNKLFDKPRAPIVAISFSVLSWKGQ